MYLTSVEVFTIVSRFRRHGINMYKLEDKLNKTVAGSFAEAEIQRVDYDSKGVFIIEI